VTNIGNDPGKRRKTTAPASPQPADDAERLAVSADEMARRLRLALDVSKIGVFEADLDTGRVTRDAALKHIYGNDERDTDETGTFFFRALHPDDSGAALATIEAGIASGETFFNAFRIVRPDGSVRHIRSRSVTFSDHEGHHRLLGANWDVTDDVMLQQNLEEARELAEARYAALERAWNEIEHRSRHDRLTGLINRHALLQSLDRLPAPTGRRAVLHIDLSRFKEINDTLGHKAGDAVLVHVVGLLERLCREGDVLARIGGDEFALILDAPHDAPHEASDAMERAAAIVEALEEPIPCEGHLCHCGVSIGVALIGDGVDGPQALINAAIALSAAKSMKGSSIVAFSSELENRTREIKQTADDILEGLETGAFIPFYQLQFDARTLAVCGVETLARWQHPRHGLLAPDRFLKIAEDIDVMWRIDRAIAAQARADFAWWRDRMLGIPRLSVNISARRMLDPDLVAGFAAMDLPAGTFAFEMLESIFLDALDETMAEAVRRIRTAGIGIEIDDFGTGHASILGLTTLHPTRLKIDRALIAPIEEGEAYRRLIAAVIEMGHALKIEVVAEGVETHAQVEILQAMGCDVLQGYGLARPMPRAGIDAFMAGLSVPASSVEQGAA
jgi:diguanylate cyclase (GGDEF)-like protein